VAVSVALLTGFAAALVWYFASDYANLPGMIAWGLLTLHLALYVTWRARDRKANGREGESGVGG
jgi:hypothetical protein